MALLIAGLMISGGSANAETAENWSELKKMIYKDRVILPSKNEITLTAPYRAADDRRVPIDISVRLPQKTLIKQVTLIIDGNPMPVSARFDFNKPKSTFTFATQMRLNGPSNVRAIVEADDGKLYMTQRYVKTSGLGACSSPPVGDPEELLKNLGKMQFKDITKTQSAKASQLNRMAHLKIKHPNLTGLQMDQITLRYILARFIKKVEVRQSGQKLFTLTGSISFSENPELAFDYQLNDGDQLEVKVEDTDKTIFKDTFPLGVGS